MNTLLIAVLPLLSGALPQGLEFGMSREEIERKLPPDSSQWTASKAELATSALEVLGKKAYVVLWVPNSGLARISARWSLGKTREQAEPELTRLLASAESYGPFLMPGQKTPITAEAILENVEATRSRFPSSAAKSQVVGRKSKRGLPSLSVVCSKDGHWIAEFSIVQPSPHEMADLPD